MLLTKLFHDLCIDEHTKVSDHLSVLNVIVSKLETIGVNIDDEDKTLRLIWPLSSSYEPIKPLLIYGKKTLSFEEVDSKIISEERKLKGENNSSSNSVLIVKGNIIFTRNKRKNFCYGL